MKLFGVILISLLTAMAGCSENGIVEDVEIINEQPSIISERIRQVAESVNIDSVKATLEVLTGVKPFIYNNDTVLIKSRFADYEGNDKAAEYIEYRLKNYGYEASSQNFNMKGRNVYAVKKGTTYPDEYFIICAHYDSLPESVISPGADDNGSGTSAVIEAARVFADLNPEYSIIFAFWDEEEQGLIGSKHFAEFVKDSNMKIKSVINIDMIGWDSNNDNYLMLAVPNASIEYSIYLKATEINSAMNLGLKIWIISSRSTASDHLSFLNNGYAAFCFIEDKQDFNGFYHSTNDMMQFLNFSYYNKNCKIIIATLASLTL